jgi:hypothetical protein
MLSVMVKKNRSVPKAMKIVGREIDELIFWWLDNQNIDGQVCSKRLNDDVTVTGNRYGPFLFHLIFRGAL